MIRKMKDWFKQSSEPVAETAPEPVAKQGLPGYVRYQNSRRKGAPLYDTTATFLKKDPLADIPIGALALLSPRLIEWAATSEDNDDAPLTYNEFPWNTEEIPA